ncbi:MAG: cytochrome c3 family protein [Candidatus Omnitrophota bacterium]|nr:cytochrome c3 family protein [Candidatus Omnitrophota bacterium]
MHNKTRNQKPEARSQKIISFYRFVCLIIFLSSSHVSFVIAQEKEFKKGCRACHSEQIDKWDASEVRHFPYAREKCESCHAAEHKKFTPLEKNSDKVNSENMVSNGELTQASAGTVGESSLTGFTAEQEKPCLICHDLNSEKIKKAHFSGDLTGVNCFNCHYTHAADKKGLLKESVHEPFVSGMCDACHNISAEGKIEVKGQTKKICLACHSSLLTKDDTVKHSGYDMLECVDCHNPHTSSEKWLLKKKITQICFDCHGKEEAAKHPYDVVPSQKINLDKGNEIWLTNDRQMSCVSCHNPHSAKIPFLLRESLEDGKLCNICHPKQ